VLEKERQRDEEALSPEDYRHIWEGEPASSIDATYYGYYMHIAEANHRICGAVYDNSLDVHTAWDIGIDDYTSIWFFQLYGNEIRLVDYYQDHNRGMEWYAKVMREKKEEFNYHYGLHFAPHDIMKRNQGRVPITTFEIAHRMGIDFEPPLYRMGVQEGIQKARINFHRCYFDKELCIEGIDCLKNYKQRFNKQKNVYEENPYHNEYSHGADAFRYAIQATELISKNTGKPKSYEEIQDEFATSEPERDEITGY
jgi:phage terminase large subunit